MDYREIEKIIKEKLEFENNKILSNISDCILSGSTDGEIKSILGKYLKDLEVNEPYLFNILKFEIQKFISECKKEGLYII